MTNSKTKSGEEAKKILREGVNLIANPVSSTLGAKGRTVLINNSGRPAHPTKDGVSVAMSIRPKDNFVASAAKVIQEASLKSLELAGDGTTTTAVLAQEIILSGMDMVADGANPIDIKRGIDMAAKAVVDYIKQKSEEIKEDYSKIEAIATVSANNEEEIGKLIANAMEQVTSNGVVKVAESNTTETEVEVVTGMEFDQGYMSSQMITHNETRTVEFQNPLFLLTEDEINNHKDIMKALEIAQAKKRALILICGNVGGNFGATMILNFRKNPDFNFGMIKAYGLGDLRKQFLEDLAVFTGANIMSKSIGRSLREVTFEDLGGAENIVSTDRTTTILGGEGTKEKIESRVRTLKNQLEKEENSTNKKILEERIAKLAGGIAIIKIGAFTEAERKEKKDRMDDALLATKAAVKEGIVPGGGIMLLRSSKAVKGLTSPNKDIQYGIDIVRQSLEAPLRKMLHNAGYIDTEHMGKIRSNKSFNYGFNLQTEKFGDMKKCGIIDPAMVVRVAVESAASVAGVLLTVDYLVSEDE
jgi:chaperonin GroEL